MRRLATPLSALPTIVAVLGLLGLSPRMAAGEDEKPAAPLCPVMARPVDFSVSVTTDEGPVFFCCQGCVKKYNKDPDKYASQVAEQRRALEAMPKVQVTCPVSGKPVDQKVFIEHDGKKVFFCCPKCPEAFSASPDKYKAKLANGYTYQTKCPVMGGDINPQVYSTLPSGLRIYHCCPACSEKLLKEPAKYTEKLRAQGFLVDLESATKPR